MVQGIRPGQPQQTMTSTGKVTVTTSSSKQPSLFGNGQPEKFGGKHNTKRDPNAEQERAKNKFANTDAGKAASQARYDAAAAASRDRTAAARDEVKPPSKPKKELPYAPPCHHKHPPYPVADGFTVIGGSGITPFNKDCDIYCSLDHAGPVSMPWEAGGPYCFVFEIKNYGVPNNVESFKKLVTWLVGQVQKGRKVHVGCMAGHGRTGMVLAAMRMEMAGDKDAIMHVRNNYCDQAVETDGQIKWLMDHYDMNKAPPRVKKGGGTNVSASSVGAVRHGNWDDPFDTGFDKANTGRYDDIERQPQHTSWVANSPWLRELEGPAADLGDEAWYEV